MLQRIRDYMETRRRMKIIRENLMDIDVKLCCLDMALNILEDESIDNPETKVRFLRHARKFTDDLKKITRGR